MAAAQETNYTGKVMLITGGANGMGAATAVRLAGLGARVIVADVNRTLGEALVQELGPSHAFVDLDVSSAQRWGEVLSEVVERFGGLDVLFLNAGVLVRPPTVPILDDPLPWITQDGFAKVVAVNLAGVVNGVVAALPYLTGRSGATILITSSGAGTEPYVPDPLYAMTKHGLIGFGRSIAPSLEGLGVTLNVLCPMHIRTGLTPPDLQDNPDYNPSPPSYIADVVVEILGSGANGEVFIARGGTALRRHVFNSAIDPVI
jgi:NAD(P)-dependent dehydrogenase (short-subunit alcohol dehydrogenase family)